MSGKKQAKQMGIPLSMPEKNNTGSDKKKKVIKKRKVKQKLL